MSADLGTVNSAKTRHTACPVCRSSKLLASIFVHEQSARHRILDEDYLRWLGCRTCGVVFQDVFPNVEEIDSYYSDNAGWDGEWDIEKRTDEEARQLRAKKLATMVTQHVLTESNSRPGRVLDFGCGFGTILDEFRKLNWTTFGIEPGPSAHQKCAKNHQMLDAIPEDKSFDLLLATSVLEHVPDPLELLRGFRKALKPNGYLFILVPNLGRLEEHRLFSNVFKGAHLYAFTRPSVVKTLELGGFQVRLVADGSEWDAADRIDGEPPGVRLRVFAQNSSMDEGSRPSSQPLNVATNAIKLFVWSRSKPAWFALHLPFGMQERYMAGKKLIRRISAAIRV